MRLRVCSWVNLVGLLLAGVLPALRAAPPQAVFPLPTVETALIGRFSRGPLQVPVEVGLAEFVATFGSARPADWPAEVQARQFFANGGSRLQIVRVGNFGPLAEALMGDLEAQTGVSALALVRDLRVVLVPEIGQLSASEFAGAFGRCRAFLEPRRLFLLLDPPPGLPNAAAAANWVDVMLPADAGFCAVYYPYLKVTLDGVPMTNAASGAIAAIYERNDTRFSIWHSPAGSSLPLLADALWTSSPSTAEQDLLNAHGICSIRQFTGVGIVPWGARTLDRVNPDNRYVSVVRTRLWIAACIERALAFTATADNGEPLWGQIRALADSFLHGLFQQGALMGTTPQQAYFVQCDATTTSVADIATHQVRLYYGTALVRPAEFDLKQLILPTYDAGRAAPATALLLRSLPGQLLIAAPTVPGFNYELEFSDSPEPGSFSPVGMPVAGDGNWWRDVPAVPPGQGYYRLAITPAR